MEIEKIADALKALGDPTRLQIVALLNSRDCCVCELVPVFGISQPAISKHLFRLKTAGLVKETRRGQWVFYSLIREQLETIGFSLTHLPDLSYKLKELEQQGLLVQCN
ncbi:ArsR/SmtB family transcription factor [Ammoniphilus resinae]|uniref:ArsR family transcriptional regulator n=1 Tax=Ammoniphilus resinae TaxID=861532 RepID=A0ABS4GVQ8_9BACL|nr:ArsR family transcriptional regulator [Ammoniphilus resinae]